MQFAAPLNEILRSATHVRVLRALFEIPRGFGVSGREIARRAGVAHPSANKALAALHAQGMVDVRRSARFDEYTLNFDNVLASAIGSLFSQEQRLTDDLKWMLRSELEPLGVRRAYLFGSVAKGDTTSRSDIDLALDPHTSANPELGAALEALSDKVRKRFGSELNIVYRRSPPTGHSDAIWRRFTKDAIPVIEESDA